MSDLTDNWTASHQCHLATGLICAALEAQHTRDQGEGHKLLQSSGVTEALEVAEALLSDLFTRIEGYEHLSRKVGIVPNCEATKPETGASPEAGGKERAPR
mgnify:CR=1 FL=1